MWNWLERCLTSHMRNGLPLPREIPQEIERGLIKQFTPKSHGLWHDGPIPINVIFSYYGRDYEVRLSNMKDSGHGLFFRCNVGKGEALFPYGGKCYKHSKWKDLWPYYPRMKQYALYEDPRVAVKDLCVIVGDVIDGNVAGYINSSYKCKELTNVEWRLEPGNGPWMEDGAPLRSHGYMMTISLKELHDGDELFVEYDWEAGNEAAYELAC